MPCPSAILSPMKRGGYDYVVNNAVGLFISLLVLPLLRYSFHRDGWE
jgi:hypothetical protein